MKWGKKKMKDENKSLNGQATGVSSEDYIR